MDQRQFCAIIDLETTGTDPQQDEIIEVGILGLSHIDYKDVTITTSYSALNEPKKSINKDIEKITGLKDHHVKGQSIDWSQVKQILKQADLIIAHNADFDRQFLLGVQEIRDDLPRWACSIKHIDWDDKGFKSKSLTYLSADHGFVNPFAHRALFDCAATFRLIMPHLHELYANSLLKEYKVLAEGAPFEVKDTLKRRGYHWDPSSRVWFKHLLENKMAAEREFLQTHVYINRPASHKEVPL